MDKFREGEDNPFDAPVAGQGLTDEPGNLSLGTSTTIYRSR
tara:strand:- start:28 stop:150 length:123 start_codon:yes stop_codon:yes gene_type:complete